MDYIMETRNVSKSYKGKTAVDNVNIHVKRGDIYGFVGPNGAGKSTIMKMLLNLTPPDAGEIYLFGEKVNGRNYEYLKRIGSIIESPCFYEGISARQNLELHCDYMGYHNRERIDEVLELTALKSDETKKVVHYSMGMKQRLAIARAILTRPEFLILDEPINALDPDGIREMRTLFQRLNREHGATIFISSHILSEVEQIADTIGIIRKGQLIKEVSLIDIHDYRTEFIEVAVDDVKKAAALIEQEWNTSNFVVISDHVLRLFEPELSGKELSALHVRNGVGLESLGRKRNTLEDYFFALTEED